MKFRESTRWTIGVLAVVAAAACADNPNTIRPSVLRGLSQGESNDTVATTPPPPAEATPGSFHGYVLGPGTGPDTMATAPRLQGVVVTVYPFLGGSGQEPIVGEAVAAMTTDANGVFQSPTVPGGEYVVTFVPPENSIYRGVYVTTTIHDGSNSGNWWVVLPRK